MAIRLSPWAGRKYYLNKMTLRELLVAYFTHHSILTYLALIAVSIWLAIVFAATPGPPLLGGLGHRPDLPAGRVLDASPRTAFPRALPL